MAVKFFTEIIVLLKVDCFEGFSKIGIKMTEW